MTAFLYLASPSISSMQRRFKVIVVIIFLIFFFSGTYFTSVFFGKGFLPSNSSSLVSNLSAPKVTVLANATYRSIDSASLIKTNAVQGNFDFYLNYSRKAILEDAFKKEQIRLQAEAEAKLLAENAAKIKVEQEAKAEQEAKDQAQKAIEEAQKLADAAQQAKQEALLASQKQKAADKLAQEQADKAKQAQIIANPPLVSTPTPSADTNYESYILEQCNKYGCNATQLIRVMYCESGGRPDAYNPSGATGLLQFMPATFYANAAKIGIVDANVHNPIQQIQVAAYMFANGQAYQWACK